MLWGRERGRIRKDFRRRGKGSRRACWPQREWLILGLEVEWKKFWGKARFTKEMRLPNLPYSHTSQFSFSLAQPNLAQSGLLWSGMVWSGMVLEYIKAAKLKRDRKSQFHPDIPNPLLLFCIWWCPIVHNHDNMNTLAVNKGRYFCILDVFWYSPCVQGWPEEGGVGLWPLASGPASGALHPLNWTSTLISYLVS